MTAALPGPQPEVERHTLALLQLTRVLVLYFVQSKGWLDGRTDFLARSVDDCLRQRRHLHRDLLEPLFFGTLNRPPHARSQVPRRFGRVPFLNGGLFEPHRLERRRRHMLPNAIWRDAFDSLFERFHFTVDERGRPGLVAPDMLGRVFEGVMEPVARRRSGTFYTPAPLVHALVRAALAAWLAPRAGCSEERADRLLDDRDPFTRRALRRLTILDPAVGSGAFLLGALDILAGPSRPESRRRILGRSLYGVDLNAAAVRLTELRLWLAVIADDRAESPEQVEPLPNLDALVRQGDSLLDRLGAPLPILDSPLNARLA
ncbi:MAG: N-6 DNA methylase, partial [Myxococcota bacterium]